MKLDFDCCNFRHLIAITSSVFKETVIQKSHGPKAFLLKKKTDILLPWNVYLINISTVPQRRLLLGTETLKVFDNFLIGEAAFRLAFCCHLLFSDWGRKFQKINSPTADIQTPRKLLEFLSPCLQPRKKLMNCVLTQENIPC